MSDNLIIEVQKVGDGRTLATINGKLYTLLAGQRPIMPWVVSPPTWTGAC